MEDWRTKAISITKYDPKFRNKDGIYSKNEWTSYSDIGKEFDGITLDRDNYLKVENEYIQLFISLAKKLNANSFLLLDIHKRVYKEDFKVKDITLFKQYSSILEPVDTINFADIDSVLKLILREYLSCDIVLDKNSNTIIRFGYDYYMYLTTNLTVESIFRDVEYSNGLFLTY